MVFPHYFGKDKLSDLVNKFFRANGMKESENTTLYSIRHNFEDRLLEAGIDGRVRKDILGHTLQRRRYGMGGGDQLRWEAIKKVAL